MAEDGKTESKPVSDKEIEDETDIVDASVDKKKVPKKSIGEKIRDGQTDFKTLKQRWEKKPVTTNLYGMPTKALKNITRSLREIKAKDGAGYGNLESVNSDPRNVNNDSETYVGAPAEKEQTYIQQEQKSNMSTRPDANKITHTKIGDHINYFENGISGNGIVAKMSSKYITIFKDDGSFHEIHINDTFHISDILVNKTWNDMDMEERTHELVKVKALSPRYLHKTWEQLPPELRSVMQSDVEHQVHGSVGGNRAGISTDTPFDAEEDYEGATHRDYKEQFEYEKDKPSTDKDTNKVNTDKKVDHITDDKRFHKKEMRGDFTYTDNPQNYKTKGVPDYNINTWGITYKKKNEDVDEE